MQFRSLGSLTTLFCLALLGCHVQASLPTGAEAYWLSLWPNTPMPKALRDLTQSDSGRRGWNLRASGTSQPRIIGNKKIDVEVYTGGAHKNSDPTTIKSDAYNTKFFLEHDLHPDQKLNLEFAKRSDEFTFLPDKVAKSIPFSSSRFPEILTRFNIQADSTDAKTLKYTLDICELPAINGEDKYCATSMESLVNFTVSKLGKNIRLLSTEVEKETEKVQQYSVVKGVKKAGDKAVVCHKLNYLYAVFYCHKVATRAYTVPLVGTDGTKAEALAVCHTDTRKWSRENLALQQLNVKPGTVPVCHFLASNTLLWVPVKL